MSKAKTPTTAAVTTADTPTPAPAPAVPQAPPLPTLGGCWVRDPVTGALSRDYDEHPAERPSAGSTEE